MIRAGKKEEIRRDSGNWVIIDIGFANRAPSCGLLFENSKPIEVRFNQAVNSICDHLAATITPTNLVIEAPLSVAFDIHGNPKGRAIEKRKGKTRYWYAGLGCAVMVSALYLVRSIVDIKSKSEVRLFEGFVSFKGSSKKSNHTNDVKLLMEVIDNPYLFADSIFTSAELKMDDSDRLQSAFLVAGIDAGIPPIIVRNV